MVLNMENQNTKKTVNEKELETLNFWKENKIFEKSVESPAGLPVGDNKIKSFSFYDGPPFATGLPHHGHILAGTIKDVIPRYKTMTGHSVRRVWGWDCHGLPIENLIEKELNLNSKKEIEELGVGKFTDACADSVLRYDGEWKQIVPRLGRWVDMKNAYKTMDWTYTESVWWAWKSLYEKKLAYEGYKIMHICPRCETPLAQSEVGLEYHDITDMTVTAKFELVDESNTFILAWTTTPWTLPGNTALAINKNLEYVKVEGKPVTFKDGEEDTREKIVFIISKKIFLKESKSDEPYTSDLRLFKGLACKILEEFTGEKLLGKKYKPVFDSFNNEEYLNKLENGENIYKVWHADFITDDSGTGIAHEAPAFGAEDMELAKANNMPIIKHVLMNGHFVSEVEDNLPALKDLVVKKKDDSISTDIEIVKLLAHSGKLFSKEKIVHSYPLCWRCKTPLLNYATSSWFVDVPKIKDKLISENLKTSWVPLHMRDGRFGKWLEGAREWAVSRKRYWGAPLPIWKNIDGSEIFVAGSLEDIASKQKSNNEYIVMRHGEAMHNVPGQEKYDSGGDTENHLTENGKNQVRESAEKLKDRKIDVIFCSPFLRTRETADLVAEVIGHDKSKIIYDDRLREHGLGILDGKSFDDSHKIVFENHAADLSSNEYGLESYNEMKIRVGNLVMEIENKYKDKNILMVTHLGLVKTVIANGLARSDSQIIGDAAKPHYRDHDTFVQTGTFKEAIWKPLSRDENGLINLHRPHIDKVILKDSKGGDMKIIGDVFDCWFESGSMPYAQLHYPFENVDTFNQNFPANFIAEGVDQTRGWFYSLLNLSVGLFDKVPFENVIVNGHILAAGGEKLSKSLKNFTDPMILVEKFGADAMRYSLVNSPAMRGEGVEFSDSLVEEVYKKNIQRLENVLDFYNMYSENAEGAKADNTSKNVLDEWILIRLQEVINKSVEGYENYKLDIAVSEVDRFIDDLSTWYLRRSRDRLKADENSSEVEKKDKRQALNTMKYIFIEFAKTIAPVMPFLAERVYKNITETNDSVHLQKYPEKRELTENQKTTLEEMIQVREIVTTVLMMRQKNNTPVRQPLLRLTLNKNFSKNILEKYEAIIREELNVKEIIISEELEENILDFTLNDELIREGKQRELSREIKDRRKELGLVASDFIILFIESDRYELIDEVYKKEMKIKEAHVSEDFIVQKA